MVFVNLLAVEHCFVVHCSQNTNFHRGLVNLGKFTSRYNLLTFITNMIQYKHCFIYSNKPIKQKITYSLLQPPQIRKRAESTLTHSQHILYVVALQLQLQLHNLHPRKSSWKFLQRPPKIVLTKTNFVILLINNIN